MERKRLDLVLIVLLGLVLAVSGLGRVNAQATNRAGLVVRFGDGSLITRCIEFGESEISGYEALTRSGLNVVAAFDPGAGAAICAIEGTGCPADDCFCASPPDYWAYWHLTGGAWVYSQIGSSGYVVRDGDVEGWSWGPGEPPPVIPFDQICIPPPTETPLPSPTLAPTATPMPTSTLEPVVWFRLDQNPIPAGNCTTLRWDTNGLKELYLDGGAVTPNGALEVCSAAPQTFELRVVTAGDDEQIHTLELGVTGNPPSPQASPTAEVEPSAGAAGALPSSTPLPAATLPPTAMPGTGTAIAETPTPTPSMTPSAAPTTRPAVVVIHAPTLPAPTETPLVVAAVLEPAVPSNELVNAVSPSTQNEGVGEYAAFGVLAAGLATVLVVLRVRQRQ